jgi:general secretion pathway protein L
MTSFAGDCMPTLLQRIREFLDWWRSGLVLLIPENRRRALLHEPALLTIEISADTHVAFDPRDGSPPQRRELDLRGGPTPQEMRSWLSDFATGELRCVVLLPDHEVLRKAVVLPEAAAGNLREVIGFELDRYTPFTEDQAWFDVRARTTEPGQIAVDLFVCRRDRVEKLLAQVETWGLRPDVIAPAGASESCNLLPVALRRTGAPFLQARTWRLAWTAAGLALVSLYLPPVLQGREVRTLETEIATLRGRAVMARQLMTERDALLARTQFLAQQRRGHAQTIDILKTLTELLSDDTWLSRLMIRGDELQIQGESAAATGLIEKLEAAPVLSDVQFRSPVTGNPQTQKDRFQLSATITPETSS